MCIIILYICTMFILTVFIFSCSKTTVIRCTMSSLRVVDLWSSCHLSFLTCWQNSKPFFLVEYTVAIVIVLQRMMRLNGGRNLLGISMCSFETIIDIIVVILCCTQYSIVGNHAFAAATLAVWNSLSEELKLFCHCLKSEHFWHSLGPWHSM